MTPEINKNTSAVLDLLREKTRALHTEIEGKLNVMSSELSTKTYLQILESFYSFYLGLQAAWEKQTPNLTWQPDFKEKILALEKDFQTLGHNPPSAKKAFANELPEPAWWGILYVTEGSNLGSQVICKHLSQRDDIKEALQFYSGHGLETGKRWRHFLQELQSPSLHTQKNEIANAGVAAFSHLIHNA